MSRTLRHSRLPDGSEALEIKTVANGAQSPDTILEAGLVLRKRDWHALEQRLRVQGEHGVKEFELSELAFNVTARSVIESWICADRNDLPLLPPPVVEPPAPVQQAPEAEPEPANPTVTEVLALAALHDAGACLGEPVEVVTEADGTVVVGGLAETEPRRQELLAAIERAPAARFEVQTLEAALLEIDVSELPPEERSPDPAPRDVRSGEMPLQPLLAKRLRGPEIAKLANLAVSEMRQSVSHAWAIRRLSERFPGERLANLDAPSRELLEQMLRQHAAAARDAAVRYRNLIESALPYHAMPPSPLSGDLEWGGETQMFLTSAQAAQRLTFALFTGSSPLDETAAEAVQRLTGLLSELEGRARRVEANAAWLLQPGLDASQASARR